MRIVFELNNLNRTADFLVQKNGILRELDENPIRHVIKQLVESVAKRLANSTFPQVADDTGRGVMYLVDGQSQVCYSLEITDRAGRNITTPTLRRNNDSYGNADYYWTKDLDEVAKEFAGHTAVVHFYVRPGNDPRNLSPDSDE